MERKFETERYMKQMVKGEVKIKQKKINREHWKRGRKRERHTQREKERKNFIVEDLVRECFSRPCIQIILFFHILPPFPSQPLFYNAASVGEMNKEEKGKKKFFNIFSKQMPHSLNKEQKEMERNLRCAILSSGIWSTNILSFNQSCK